MKVYLDFDGTFVEHVYPKIGVYNRGAVEVIEALQKKGHEIIINTYRADLDGEEGKDLVLRIVNTMIERHNKMSGTNADKILAITNLKIQPHSWENNFKQDDILFLDDQSYGVPLIKALMSNDYMVDWIKIEEQLTNKNII